MGEGDEAQVVLVGAEGKVAQHLGHTHVVRHPGVLQPPQYVLRCFAQRIDLGDLAAGVVDV